MNKYQHIKNRLQNLAIRRRVVLYVKRLQSLLFSKLKYKRIPNIEKGCLYSELPLMIAIAVTDHGDDVTAGDYFTAQELSISLESYGWKVIFLSRKKGEWYHFSERVNVLLSLLDSYNLNKICSRKNNLITIAWARNWFDNWCDMPCFNAYNIVFSSSKISCDYIKKNSRQTALVLPIASNPKRFMIPPQCENIKWYESDICFTGSYWNHSRDIMEGLSSEALNKYKCSIYGANWDQFDKFKSYNKGFVRYSKMPCVYHYTKIVIDDANHVTKPYGSVNSRVFDAIMSGALVITNGFKGSKELFDDQLPCYETKEELDQLLHLYLNNEERRVAKVKVLHQIIIENHTYAHRANTFRDALSYYISITSIAIKLPIPSWDEAHSWGDFHMAISLKKELEELNYRVVLQILPEWDNKEGNKCNVVLVFRGLSYYKIKPHQINIMWNISHPDKVTIDEYEQYNKIYIASKYWAEIISNKTSVSVDVMLQCTDPNYFYKPGQDKSKENKQQLLFVGNSRKIYRKIIKDLLPTKYNLAVYGKDWEGLISDNYIMGEYIPNYDLYQYYGTTDILLNDHWDDMREKGFISNRIFDALACGAFIITDHVKYMGELGVFVQSYDKVGDLKKLVEHYISNPTARKKISCKGREYILNNHTFKHRAKQLSSYIKSSIE